MNTLNFGLARDQVVHLETEANLYASSAKQRICYVLLKDRL